MTVDLTIHEIGDLIVAAQKYCRYLDDLGLNRHNDPLLYQHIDTAITKLQAANTPRDDR